jgi:signal transduction histidine kinase
VDRIINLLNNLNLLASSKFKPLDLFKDAVNIGKVIDEVVKAYTPALNARKIKCEVKKIMRAICICDEALVRRTIENVMDNAVKYTPEGGAISLDVVENRGKIDITITNTCPAINKEDSERIFQPFFRGKNIAARTADGKGLGLYISRYIMRSHGGDIKLNNTYGNLFSLTISLPMR